MRKAAREPHGTALASEGAVGGPPNDAEEIARSCDHTGRRFPLADRFRRVETLGRGLLTFEAEPAAGVWVADLRVAELREL